MNCHGMVSQLQGTPSFKLPASPQTMIVSFAFGIAGDAYMNMVKAWTSKCVSYQEQFNTFSSTPVNLFIAEIVEKNVDEKYREWFLKFPKDIEESMGLAKSCFDVALKLCWEVETDGQVERRSLIRRRGNANNEIGVFYLNHCSEVIVSRDEEVIPSIQPWLRKSQMHMMQGVEDFTGIGDKTNEALLYSNLGKLSRLEANFYGQNMTNMEEKECNASRLVGYQESLKYYYLALEALKEDRRGSVYQSISWELCSAHYTYAVFLLEGATEDPIPVKDLEKEIVDHFNKALNYCDLKGVPGARLSEHVYRYAVIHYKLGSLYHARSVSGNNINSSSTSTKEFKRKQIKAEGHYLKAVEVFEKESHTSEYLRAQLERVCLHEDFEGQQSFAASKKAVHTVLEIMCDSIPMLEKANTRDEVDLQLLDIMTVRLTANLKQLNKILTVKKAEKSSSSSSRGGGGLEAKLSYAKSLYLLAIKLDKTKPEFKSDLIHTLQTAQTNLHLLK